MDIVVHHAPRFSGDEAAAIARDRYGLAGRVTPLPSERDQNFRIECADGLAYVL